MCARGKHFHGLSIDIYRFKSAQEFGAVQPYLDLDLAAYAVSIDYLPRLDILFFLHCFLLNTDMQ